MAAASPSDATTIRQRVLDASRRIRRVKAMDRLATRVISLGGLFVVVAVSFIFVRIIAEISGGV